jgi:hypothetical protein
MDVGADAAAAAVWGACLFAPHDGSEKLGRVPPIFLNASAPMAAIASVIRIKNT